MENNNTPINVTFNLALFGYLLLSYLTEGFFTPETETAERVPWDNIIDSNPLLGYFSAGLLVIILIVCGTYLIQNFWNRFLTDVFKIRKIQFQEALSIMLLIVLFSV